MCVHACMCVREREKERESTSLCATVLQVYTRAYLIRVVLHAVQLRYFGGPLILE